MTDEGRAPSVSLRAAVQVTLRTPRTDEERRRHRLPPDDGTVVAFLEWQLAEGVLPLPGTAASSPSDYDATFAAEHAEQIEAWFTARGVTIERDEATA